MYYANCLILFQFQCDLSNDRAVSKDEGLKCARKHQVIF